MTARIEGREMQVTALETPARVSQHLKAQGFDGTAYMAKGRRGAVYMVYRAAGSGQFEVAARV